MNCRSIISPVTAPPENRENPSVVKVWLSKTPTGNVKVPVNPATEIVADVACSLKTVHGEGMHGCVDCTIEFVLPVNIIVKAESVNEVVPKTPVPRPWKVYVAELPRTAMGASRQMKLNVTARAYFVIMVHPRDSLILSPSRLEVGGVEQVVASAGPDSALLIHLIYANSSPI